VTEYFDQLLQQTKESGWVLNEELTFREIDDKEGYIRGTLHIYGGFTLHVAEYIDIKEGYTKDTSTVTNFRIEQIPYWLVGTMHRITRKFIPTRSINIVRMEK